MKNKKRMAAVALAGTLAASGILGGVGLASTTVEAASADSSSSQSTGAGTPPAKPGENSDSSASGSSENGGTPPEKPDGGPGSGNGQEGNGGPGGEAPSGMNGGGGADTQTFDYSGSYSGKLEADGKETSSDNESFEATDKDQNAAEVENGGTLTITKGTLKKSGDDTDGDNCNFYGLNSIFLGVGEKSKGYISNSTLSADSEGSNGIFATDSATVYANNDSIRTTAGNSRGLDATYGGTILANKMKIETAGDHCAALATDRGGGNVSVTNSTFTTKGSGSPLLYSTGDIEVDNVTGTAEGSQIAGMEGLNKILIDHSDLTSTNTSTTGSDPVANGVIIYQSTSGDAETSTGEAALFQAVDSTLTSKIESGSMFYLTNTTANVLLSNTTLDFNSEKANLLEVEGNDSNNWGTAGSNGATVNFTALKETLSGNISVDTISSLNLFLLDGTTYTGQMTITENSVNTSKTDAPITVNLSSDSTWVVTGDSTISNLNAEKGAKIVDEKGKTVTIVANGETVVKGDSDITVTVTGSYSNTVTTSDINEISTDAIDRSDFDSYYGTSTTFGTNGGSGAVTTEAKKSGGSGASEKESYPIPQIAGGIALLVLAGGTATVIIRKKKREQSGEEL